MKLLQFVMLSYSLNSHTPAMLYLIVSEVQETCNFPKGFLFYVSKILKKPCTWHVGKLLGTVVLTWGHAVFSGRKNKSNIQGIYSLLHSMERVLLTT